MLLLVFIVGACRIQSQVPTLLPRIVTPTTTNQVQIYNGTTFVLKELVGFTVSGSQLTIPSATDGSVTNEGLLGISAGTSTSSILTTNTSTGSGVTINATSPLTITEATSSNGGSVTLGVNVVDGSVTNERTTFINR